MVSDRLLVPLSEHEKAGPLTVCVTGATGFVAGAIVERLLAAGHTVKGTCRDPADTRKVGPLLALPGAERLTLYKADLQTEGSFDAAVAGCSLVMHTASPVIFRVAKGKTAKEVLLDPAVNGVRNLLRSVERTGTVRRVVLTSSIAAVTGDNWEHGQDALLTPGHWNHTSTDAFMSYNYSKVLAEKAAWDFHQTCFAKPAGSGRGGASASELEPTEVYAARAPDPAHRWHLACVNPAFVIGPILSPAQGDAETVQLFAKAIKGQLFPMAPAVAISTCDVREVAAAHTRAGTHPGASGRYLVSSAECSTMFEWSRILSERYPLQALFIAPKAVIRTLAPLLGASADVIDATYAKPFRVDNSRMINELGIVPVPLRRSLLDAAASIVEHGVARPPRGMAWMVRIATATGLVVLGRRVMMIARAQRGSSAR